MKHFFLGMCLMAAMNSVAQHKLEGRIIDRIDKHAIPQANIQLLEIGQEAQSDSSGYFQFVGNFPLKLTLIIQASEYETQHILLTERQTIPLLVELILTHTTDIHEVRIDTKTIEIANRHVFSVENQKIATLNRTSNVSLGEAIAKIPGVYQSTTGNGISKPVIRGLQGMRVVTYLNGLRIEGQQWGSDHGMGISEIGIGGVEVIKGPASLYYGADALGGVLYFVDEPFAVNGKKSIELKQTFHSASMGSSTSVLWKTSGSKFRVLLGASYASHADFQLPNQRYAYNTRFQEIAVKGNLSWNTTKSVQYVRFSSNQLRIGIPGESSDSVLVSQGFQATHRGRAMVLPTQYFQNHSLSFEKRWFLSGHELSLLVGQTLNRLMEFEESFAEKAMNMNLWNSTYQFKWMNEWKRKIQMTTGIQGMFQLNQNHPEAEERLMPNARTFDNGLYTVLKKEMGENVTLTGGVRLDIRYLQSLDSINGNAPIDRVFASPNASIGIRIDRHKKWSGQWCLSTGYRAPHLTELLANGFHHGALRYEIGSLQLKSERAMQLDFLLNYKTTHVEWSMNPFYTMFNQFICLNPIDSMLDGMPVFRYEQLPQVHMYGVDLKLHYHLHFLDKLHMESQFSYVRFMNDNQSISLIPQPRLAHRISYQMDFGKKWKLSTIDVEQTSFFRQLQVATYEKSSPFFQLVNVSVHVLHLGPKQMDIELSAKNLFNASYMDHLSRLKNIGMPNQGRSIVLSFKWKLS